MKVIKTLTDIEQLQKNRSINRELLYLLTNEFFEAAREAIFPDQEPNADFSLEEYGYLVVLEKGDSEAEWAQEGLSMDSTGTRIRPELVELMDAGCIPVYRILVMPDNDHIMRFYAQAGIHDPEFEEWLQGYLT